MRPLPRPSLAPFLAALALGSACASPLGGRDFELAAGASALPGPGVVVGASQRMAVVDEKEIDVEIDWTHQWLDTGVENQRRRGDDSDQVRLGFRVRWPEAEPDRWTARVGVAWLRAQGDPEFLDLPGDYGGAYLGLGYDFELSEHLLTGPDFHAPLLRRRVEGRLGPLPRSSRGA